MPASIGPPETKITGIFRRNAAISMPGVILSQLEMHTIASAQWAFTMYSTESAISSRDGREEHAAVAHGDAVIHRDGVELFGHAAGGFDLFGDQFAQIAQMHVARHELGKGVDHGDDRLAEIGVGHPGRAPQCAGTRHIAAMSGGGGTVPGMLFSLQMYL